MASTSSQHMSTDSSDYSKVGHPLTVHSDMDDVREMPDELPPQYADRRMEEFRPPVDSKATYQAPLANYGGAGSSSQIQPAPVTSAQRPTSHASSDGEFNPYMNL